MSFVDGSNVSQSAWPRKKISKGKVFFSKMLIHQELTGVISVISSVRREEGDVVGHSI